MNALIDLGKCREYMTITIGGKEHQIKLSGTIDDPYFCGKDICDILDYKDFKCALKKNVPSKYKKKLVYFYAQNGVDLGGGNLPPPKIWLLVTLKKI